MGLENKPSCVERIQMDKGGQGRYNLSFATEPLFIRRLKMSHGRISRGVIGILFVGVLVVLTGGCGDSSKVKALRQENMILNQRIAELEEQLHAGGAGAASGVQSYSGYSVYIVAGGDTLWSIAKTQLGNGNRYKEILPLNPHITEHQPLKIGTKLLLPNK